MKLSQQQKQQQQTDKTLELKKYLKDTRCLRTQWATTTKHKFNIHKAATKTITMTDNNDNCIRRKVADDWKIL